MNRTAATALLTQHYRELASDAKFTTDQTTAAYSGAIDMALRQLGVDESALATADVAQADTLKYIACLNYYTLKRFSTLLAVRFDVEAGNKAIKADRSQAFKAVQELMEAAAVELQQYGIFVGGIEGMQMGRVTLDFLEPSLSPEFGIPWL